MNLRDYQICAIKAIENTFKVHNRQFVEMPTGSGKTITFLSYAKNNHNNILIIVPTRQLLNQVYDSALLFYDKSEISRKGNQFNEPVRKVHICIINSTRGNYLHDLIKSDFDVVIIDEAHHSQSNSYKRLINALDKSKKQLFLGVTATPNRTDGLFLKEILHTCSFRLELLDMIADGHLCDIEGYRIKTNLDISEVRYNNGDFSINELYKKLCNESRNNMIIDTFLNEMSHRKTIIFCINILHSKQIAKLLSQKGISSKHIDGKMKPKERNAILDGFRNGLIQVICNCQLLTEGFDEPSIDGIILARPTCSRSLFIQMIGRGLRKFPGKENCKIIDIVDNHKALIGFNSLCNDNQTGFRELAEFKSVKQVIDNVAKETIKVTEFIIERVDLISHEHRVEIDATDSMYEYLDANNVLYFAPLSFDEGSFLIWKNELEKRFINGVN